MTDKRMADPHEIVEYEAIYTRNGREIARKLIVAPSYGHALIFAKRSIPGGRIWTTDVDLQLPASGHLGA